MFADPRHSRIVFINPSRAASGKRRCDSLSLLRTAIEIFGIAVHILGDRDNAPEMKSIAETEWVYDGDGLSLWNDHRFKTHLGDSGTGVIFVGGAWLEEDVFIAVLEGARLGYDVRVLADLSIARCDCDRALVLDRFSLHGILATTVRQTLLEWAASLGDYGIQQKVRQLLR